MSVRIIKRYAQTVNRKRDTQTGIYTGHLLRSVAVIGILAAFLTAQGGMSLAETVQKSGVVNVADKSTIVQNTTEKNSAALSYKEYLKNHEKDPVGNGAAEIQIPVDLYNKSTAVETTLLNEYQGYSGAVVTTTGNSIVRFPVSVDNAGFYQIRVEYYPIKGDGGTIVRTLMLDGAVPFRETEEVEFSRIWTDRTKAGQEKDKMGNDIRPKQVESPQWTTGWLFDPAGFYSDPLSFYLSNGQHEISLISVMEPLAIRSITLVPRTAPLSYADYKNATASEKGNQNPQTIRIQGESATAKSDQTLYPMQDRSSPDTDPYSVKLQRFNTIGGERWKTVGQWIEWTVTVPEDAFYTIALRWKQDIKTNDVSVRECRIDGILPFQEAANLLFQNHSGWRVSTLSDPNEGSYEFYMKKGTHTIQLKVGLGEYAAIVEEAQSLLYDLNSVYRKIVTITGPNPDQYRDYQFNVTIPDAIQSMKTIYTEMEKMETQVRNLTGGGGQSTAALTKLIYQLKEMHSDIETIAYRLTDFQNNISSYGSWINQISEQPLEIDYLMLCSKKAGLPRSDAPVYSIVWHYLSQFIASFTTDYEAIGTMAEETKGKNITVWVGSGVGTTAGRDQSQLIRQLINENFTPELGISVKLQLVSMGSLLPATLAGIGPDVALQQSQADPLNYALRSAVCDLSELPDAAKVMSRFYPSALEPFQMDGHLYALPETQSYPMLFYRQDVLNELGITLDMLDDWDSLLLRVLPVIQKSYLQFGLPANINSYAMLLYQEGGSFYTGDRQASALGSVQGISAFEKFTGIYTEYRQLMAYDFANRFRTGEMPIAINDFTAYNQLSVFAPEIKGLWGMRPVPGIRQKDGSINRTVASTVSGGVLLSNSKDRQSAWEFLKWWTNTETQTDYGNELESIMGAAARYPTANIESIDKMKWEKTIKENLEIQQRQTRAIPEIPGGYFTPRHFDFAFRDVVLSGKEVRETISKAAENISDEIQNKRIEFNLPTAHTSK